MNRHFCSVSCKSMDKKISYRSGSDHKATNWKNTDSKNTHRKNSGGAMRSRFLSAAVLNAVFFARKKILAVLSSTVFLFSGCAIESPPTLEEIHQQSSTLTNLDLTEAWRAQGAAAGPISDNWLASFGDEQLNALVEEAMLNNPDLRIGALRVEQAAQYLEYAKAALRPSVSLFGTGGVNMGGGDALQFLSLGASWEMDLWGRLRYGREAYAATYASTQADFEFARQSLAATMAKAWFSASETYLQLQLADEMLESSEELVTLAENRVRVGLGNEQDVSLARANLGTFRDTELRVRLAHEQTLRALELLLGRYPGAELQSRQDLPQLPGQVPAGLPIEMLERRPDLVAAERRIAAAFNRVGEAEAAKLPSLTLNANVANIQSDILELKEDFENPAGGAGARILAPLYMGGALQTQVEIRTLEQKEAVAQYAQMALRALGDVENALAAVNNLSSREVLLQQVMDDNQHVLELVQTNYRVGSGDLRSVQQQQIALHTSRIALLRVQSEQLIQRANLHLALGGSFENPPPPESEDDAAN